jgi:hypothetical protein
MEFVVLDNIEGEKYEHLGNLHLDSSTQVHTLAFRGGEAFKIVVSLAER